MRKGGKKKSGSEIVQWSSRYLKEYHAVTERPTTAPAPRVTFWTPPPTDRYKINVDGAVFKTQEAAGVGVLVRDCHGQVIAALSKKINAPLGPLETEVKAVEAAVQFARDVGVQDCIIEGNSLITYNALSGNTSPPSSVAAVISGIRVLSGFLRRQCNRPAHQLAKHVTGVVDFIVWLEENLCFIEPSLHYDILFLN